MYCSLPQKVSCSFLACNKSPDFLCEGNDNATCKGQKAVSSLGRVVGFEGKTNLHDTKAEHNHTDSPHQTENEIGQVVDYLNGGIGSKGGYGSTKHKGNCHNSHTVETRMLPFSWTI